MQGGTTFTAITRLPLASAHVTSVQFHWGDIKPNSRLDLWTQQGAVPLNPADAGAFSLAGFNTSIDGDKSRSTNIETPCKQIPSNHRYIAFKYVGDLTTTICAAVITLEN
jgi:hypothetical protein